MENRETAEEMICRLSREFRFNGRKDDGSDRGCPKIAVEYGGSWNVRMTNHDGLTCVFQRKNGDYIKVLAQGETLIAALEELENLCRKQRNSGAVLLDPGTFSADGKRTKRVTLNDIAKKVGCSRAAVSFAILGNHSISDDLKMRIFAEIERCNYRPSAGRSGVSRKTVVLQRIYDEDPDGISRVASLLMKRGYNPVCCYLPLYEPLNEAGIAALTQLRDMPNIAGVLSMHPALESMDILRYSGDLPVTINSRPDSMLSNCYYDYSAAGELVAEQIRSFGHRKAAFVSYGEFLGREYQLIAEGLKRKKRGRRTIDILDVPVPASICKLEVITPLLDDALKKGYTFFFAQSEEHCLLIKQWAEQQKIAIPEDLSLMYLDYDKMAEQFRPDATAVVCPFQEILKSVADEMVCKIEHRSLDGKVFYPYIRDRNTLAPAKNKRKSALKRSGK